MSSVVVPPREETDSVQRRVLRGEGRDRWSVLACVDSGEYSVPLTVNEPF